MTSTDLPLAMAVPATGRRVSTRIWQTAFASVEFRIGLAVFVLLLAAALLYPELSGIDPSKMNIRAKLTPPIFMGEGWSWAHPLGTDQLGRDMLARALVGLRYSLLIGVSTTVLMLLAGAMIGLFSGYFGGRTDTVLMRLTDAQLSIPMIILAITILGVSRPTIPSIILVLGLAGWPVYARVMRSTVMSERRKEYVRGAMVLGATDLRIMFTLLLPLVLPPMAFVAVLDIARMMIFESVLGFLGLGVQPPTPTFGNVIADGRKYLMNAWWIATMPGVFLVLTLTSINLMGAALERARNSIYGGA
ncbi:ABC transporter permease subunit [Rhodobacter sphaeroides]|jgi:peptide/nickel transport system permease protein|uniref:ABC peptide/nickel/opine transporter, inner membrane subunit n=1 Tax=Cereibacter sphaeroides (strain ATCC 17023 / DSM 158 / JCM 6121 / CCUG 31486 / LMG 2827 / NBRC 12203 / NCIMB 8253 / ATH 2.4.1.) TaxID=272943 RepID=Q3J6J0_CERS4|nr:ABC transporter permease [Cereibacter sphaeroides]ABN75222.1 binding-protein-dependent transport systems inner membrane component [Cereibacter sphaeroides ATCC 17029]ABA77594.1 ABC peptide/nickel/opine transporter, inner membrane subunit [Cereibacter sphaeroides 2.4.1]AMJ45998.1 peptide ABC transporter permease [Cereibacter sphaeroides]ANS32709.1 peptide ABC transporter permease [Cereibacter sphaeroides]ATN61762.1 peptide ABC transporter permease [Cereibacter sphaeroides]